MAASGTKSMKKKPSSSRADGGAEKDFRRQDQVHVRSDVERRSKGAHDRPSLNTIGKGKGRVRHETPPAKKQRVKGYSDSDFEAEDEEDDDHEWSGEEGTDGEFSMSEATNDSRTGSERVAANQQHRHRVMKKLVTLDVNGVPWSNMKDCLADDIKKYAKNLDPTTNWESQPSPLRSQLFKRVYKDAGQLKPADVTQEQWNTLVRRRSTEDSQVLSEHMRSISQGKGSKVAQLKAIEKDAIVKLTLQHGRKPYQTEITDEVAREYTKQQLEKRKAALQKGSDMEEVCTRVVDIEESVSRLEARVAESQNRMEEMLRAFMAAQTRPTRPSCRSPSPIPRPTHASEQAGLYGDHNATAGPSHFSGAKPPTTGVLDTIEEELGERRASIPKMPTCDGAEEEFLKVLQKQDDVLGLAEGAKSLDIVILSGHNDDLPDEVAEEVILEAPAEDAVTAKGRKLSATVQVAEEDAILEPTSRPRRMFIQMQLMKAAVQGAPTKPTRSNVGKAALMKKSDASKKK